MRSLLGARRCLGPGGDWAECWQGAKWGRLGAGSARLAPLWRLWGPFCWCSPFERRALSRSRKRTSKASSLLASVACGKPNICPKATAEIGLIISCSSLLVRRLPACRVQSAACSVRAFSLQPKDEPAEANARLRAALCTWSAARPNPAHCTKRPPKRLDHRQRRAQLRPFLRPRRSTLAGRQPK